MYCRRFNYSVVTQNILPSSCGSRPRLCGDKMLPAFTEEAVEAALGNLRDATSTEIVNIQNGLQGAEKKLSDMIASVASQGADTQKELTDIVDKLKVMESQLKSTISDLKAGDDEDNAWEHNSAVDKLHPKPAKGSSRLQAGYC